MADPTWKRWLSGVLGFSVGILAIAIIPESNFFIRPEVATDQSPSAERWVCPMMDFIGTHPGTCPVCGMTLQRATAGEISREQAKRMGVQLSTITAGPALVTVHAYGAVRYDDRTEQIVIARVAGRIVGRHAGALHLGTSVAIGDPLYDLFSSEVLGAQTELATALRIKDHLLKSSVIARFARWNLTHVADAIIAGGQPLETIVIRSPFAGRTIGDEESNKEGMVKIGQDIDPGQPLVRLVSPDSFMLVVHVPEPRARLIRTGQRVALASDDVGELPDVEASVSWIAPELNPEIRAREIHLHLRDPHGRLLPGSLVNARVKTALAADLTPADPDDQKTWGSFPLIPASAVLSTGVRNVAWKLDGVNADGHQRFSIAPLALGQRIEDANGNDFFVVRAGLQAGDQVASQGAFLIDSQAQLAGSKSLLFPVGN
ncbi:MAG: efflux RND transporter periplasmic adaptor subunit [Planctomycetota bacterium]